MDDFGNDYRTKQWEYSAEEYAHSMATFGMFDDVALDICLHYGQDYAKCDI